MALGKYLVSVLAVLVTCETKNHRNFPILNLHSKLHSFLCRKLKFTLLLKSGAVSLDQNKILPPTSKLNLTLSNLAYKREDGTSNHHKSNLNQYLLFKFLAATIS